MRFARMGWNHPPQPSSATLQLWSLQEHLESLRRQRDDCRRWVWVSGNKFSTSWELFQVTIQRRQPFARIWFMNNNKVYIDYGSSDKGPFLSRQKPSSVLSRLAQVRSSSRRGKEEEHLRHSLQRTEQKLATQLATEERFVCQQQIFVATWEVKKRATGLFGVSYSPVIWGL